VISDRFDRRRVLIVADVIRGSAIGAIGALAVSGSLELWHLFVLVAVYGVGESLFPPAFGAIVPDIVPRELLLEANSLDMVMRPLAAQLAGPALGGVAIATLGTGGAFLLDAASFAVSAAALLAMAGRPLPPREDGAPSSAFREIAEGFRFVRTHTWLWGTLVAAAVALLAFWGPSEVLVPYVVKNELDGSAGDLGLIFAAGGVGAIAASLLMGQLRVPRRHITFMYVTWTVSGVGIAAFALTTALWQAMLVWFLRAGTATAGLIIWMTLVQTRVPRHLLGRVSSLDWFVSFGLVPVSFAITGPVAETAGVTETLLGAGVIASAVTVLFLFVPGMRDTEREAEPERIRFANRLN
jgi:MFS family permease